MSQYRSPEIYLGYELVEVTGNKALLKLIATNKGNVAANIALQANVDQNDTIIALKQTEATIDPGKSFTTDVTIQYNGRENNVIRKTVFKALSKETMVEVARLDVDVKFTGVPQGSCKRSDLKCFVNNCDNDAIPVYDKKSGDQVCKPSYNGTPSKVIAISDLEWPYSMDYGVVCCKIDRRYFDGEPEVKLYISGVDGYTTAKVTIVSDRFPLPDVTNIVLKRKTTGFKITGFVSGKGWVNKLTYSINVYKVKYGKATQLKSLVDMAYREVVFSRMDIETYLGEAYKIPDIDVTDSEGVLGDYIIEVQYTKYDGSKGTKRFTINFSYPQTLEVGSATTVTPYGIYKVPISITYTNDNQSVDIYVDSAFVLSSKLKDILNNIPGPACSGLKLLANRVGICVKSYPDSPLEGKQYVLFLYSWDIKPHNVRIAVRNVIIDDNSYVEVKDIALPASNLLINDVVTTVNFNFFEFKFNTSKCYADIIQKSWFKGKAFFLPDIKFDENWRRLPIYSVIRIGNFTMTVYNNYSVDYNEPPSRDLPRGATVRWDSFQAFMENNAVDVDTGRVGPTEIYHAYNFMSFCPYIGIYIHNEIVDCPQDMKLYGFAISANKDYDMNITTYLKTPEVDFPIETKSVKVPKPSKYQVLDIRDDPPVDPKKAEQLYGFVKVGKYRVDVKKSGKLYRCIKNEFGIPKWNSFFGDDYVNCGNYVCRAIGPMVFANFVPSPEMRGKMGYITSPNESQVDNYTIVIADENYSTPLIASLVYRGRTLVTTRLSLIDTSTGRRVDVLKCDDCYNNPVVLRIPLTVTLKADECKAIGCTSDRCSIFGDKCILNLRLSVARIVKYALTYTPVPVPAFPECGLVIHINRFDTVAGALPVEELILALPEQICRLVSGS